MLRNFFFSTSLEINLSELQNYTYLIKHACFLIIIIEKMRKILTRSKFNKILRLDDITNRILKTCSQKLISLLTSLFQACVTLEYHLRVFRKTHSITLKKLNKSNYFTSKTYRFIVLLNTFNKALKTVMTDKITYLAKKFKLLLKTQMRVRRNRSTKSALKLLIEQIHTI